MTTGRWGRTWERSAAKVEQRPWERDHETRSLSPGPSGCFNEGCWPKWPGLRKAVYPVYRHGAGGATRSRRWASPLRWDPAGAPHPWQGVSRRDDLFDDLDSSRESRTRDDRDARNPALSIDRESAGGGQPGRGRPAVPASAAATNADIRAARPATGSGCRVGPDSS